MRQSAQRHLARLMTALTDFHKAQCFFMLATNVAALVVTKRGGLDPQSLQQIYNSWIFLRVVAVNGFLPTTFTLANLHLVGMLSWYLILLSGLTVALSIATLAVVGKFNPSQDEMNNLFKIAASGGPAECDGMNPGVFCYAPMDSYQSRTYSNDQDPSTVKNAVYRMLAFCLVVMLLLVGYHSGLSPKDFGRYPISSLKKIKILEWSRNRMQFFAHRVVARVTASHKWQLVMAVPNTIISKIKARYEATPVMRNSTRVAFDNQKIDSKGLAKAAVRLAFYAIFLAFYIFFFVTFLKDLAWFHKNDVYNNNWNFGQVCAITVWAPPICEYIHLEVRGMQRGFEHRLLPPFRVTRSSDVENNTATGRVSGLDHEDEDMRRCEGSEVDEIALLVSRKEDEHDDRRSQITHRMSISYDKGAAL